MFKVIFTVLLILNITYATTINKKNSCLTISSSPTTQCSKKPEFLNTSINLGELNPGSSNHIYQMPVYINTNTNGIIEMKMNPIQVYGKNNRKNRKLINAKYTSLLTGKVTTFREGKRVELLPQNFTRFRDGHKLVGYITFMIPTISEMESTDKFDAVAKVHVYNQFRSGKGNIRIKYFIKPILVVGLYDVSSFTGDKVFKYARIDFGMLKNDSKTVKEADVYVKSNYQNIFVYMKFDDVPPLKHNRADEFIDVEYYFRPLFFYKRIRQGSEICLFSLLNNDGTRPVGRLKFIADKANGKLAGNYGASIRVTISAE